MRVHGDAANTGGMAMLARGGEAACVIGGVALVVGRVIEQLAPELWQPQSGGSAAKLMLLLALIALLISVAVGGLAAPVGSAGSHARRLAAVVSVGLLAIAGQASVGFTRFHFASALVRRVGTTLVVVTLAMVLVALQAGLVRAARKLLTASSWEARRRPTVIVAGLFVVLSLGLTLGAGELAVSQLALLLLLLGAGVAAVWWRPILLMRRRSRAVVPLAAILAMASWGMLLAAALQDAPQF